MRVTKYDAQVIADATTCGAWACTAHTGGEARASCHSKSADKCAGAGAAFWSEAPSGLRSRKSCLWPGPWQPSSDKIGLDIATGEPMDPCAAGIYDNFNVKRQMLDSAAVISSQLLLVDEVIRAGRQMKKG